MAHFVPAQPSRTLIQGGWNENQGKHTEGSAWQAVGEINGGNAAHDRKRRHDRGE